MSAASAGKVNQSVVQILVQVVERDLMYPWQVRDIYGSSGTGVILSGQRILTADHVVADGSLIHLRKLGDDKRYEASIEFFLMLLTWHY